MFGVPTAWLLFGDRRGGPYFLSCGCLISVIDVDSRFTTRGGEDKRLLHPCRFPVYVEWYREDWCVFIVRVSSVELVRDESVFYVSGELCCCKGVFLPFVYTVYCVVEEDFMVVDSCDVEWCGCCVLGCRGRAGYVGYGSLLWL